jgi:hypothetical protein
MPYTCNRCHRRIDLESAVILDDDDVLCHRCYDYYYDHFRTVIEEEMDKECIVKEGY